MKHNHIKMHEPRKKRVAVIVLGDVGRSPRVQYHANSLAKLDSIQEVLLIGYTGEACMKIIQNEPKISILRFSIDEQQLLFEIPILRIIIKGLQLVITLLLTLLRQNISTIDMILIQNPPCVPAALVCIFLAIFFPVKFVIDWHNLGFKMLEEKHGSKHPVVFLSKCLEFLISRCAQGHICVSAALHNWLQENFLIQSLVVYDRPSNIFSSTGTDLYTEHNLFRKFNFVDTELFPRIRIEEQLTHSNYSWTTCTYINNDKTHVCVREDCAHVLISSTSWTPDENFDMLLDAMLLLDSRLSQYEKDVKESRENQFTSVNGNQWPRRVVLVITGKGPLKDKFMSKVATLESSGSLVYVAIRSVWLEPEEYPLMVGCADLGICMHTSTSGLDLPMKVLDMFGSCVPVCAAHFPAISELVQHGVNGMIFHSASELESQIADLFLLDKPATRVTVTESEPSPVRHHVKSAALTPIGSLQSLGDLVEDFVQVKLPSEEGFYLNNSGLPPDLASLRIGVQSIASWDEYWMQYMAFYVDEIFKIPCRSKRIEFSIFIVFVATMWILIYRMLGIKLL